MDMILTVLAVGVVLLVSEFGWRKHILNDEVGRKFVHIIVGSFVAFWPYYLDWGQIRTLSVAFLGVVIISNYLRLFHAIHSVQRPTYGEACFALTVGLLTTIVHSKTAYAVALLEMSLADGLAAIVGTRFGGRNGYHVLGHKKSIIGTATFMLVSVLLLVGYAHHATGIAVSWMLAITVVSAGLENVAPMGLDNLLVPLFVGWMLTILS
jgi:phytol kinase